MKLTRLKSDRPRRDFDFYPTPYGLAHKALRTLFLEENIRKDAVLNCLDAGAGDGVWGKALFDVYAERGYNPLGKIHLLGVDIDKDKPIYPYTMWSHGDYLNFTPSRTNDLIFGNPPYSLMEEFIRKSFENLSINGYVFFLGRLEFLASKKRHYGLFTDLKLKRVYVLSRRPSFFSTNGHKTTDAQDYALYLWQKDYRGLETELAWLYWEYIDGKD